MPTARKNSSTCTWKICLNGYLMMRKEICDSSVKKACPTSVYSTNFKCNWSIACQRCSNYISNYIGLCATYIRVLTTGKISKTAWLFILWIYKRQENDVLIHTYKPRPALPHMTFSVVSKFVIYMVHIEPSFWRLLFPLFQLILNMNLTGTSLLTLIVAISIVSYWILECCMMLNTRHVFIMI